MKFLKTEGKVFASSLYEKYKATKDKYPKTLLDMFIKRLEEQKEGNIFGSIVDNKLKCVSAEATWKKINSIGSFLTSITEPNELIGLYSDNREEWLVSEYACYFAKCTNVVLYSTFQTDALNAILDEIKVKTIFASAIKAKKLVVDILEDDRKQLKNLIMFDKDEVVADMYKKIGIDVYFFEDILTDKCVKNVKQRKFCEPNDLATICYTSGTTGLPKGVKLTHKNFMSCIRGFLIGMEGGLYPDLKNMKSLRYMSYLPLAHVLERICVSIAVSCGATVCFFRGIKEKILDDYQIIKPVFVPAVPRVLNVFEEKIKTEIASLGWFKRFLVGLGIKYKIFMQMFGIYTSWVFDFLIFKNIYRKFGGNIEYILCGGASINPSTVEYLQAVLSCRIFQGYGQTEGLAANIVQSKSSTSVDGMGVPFPSCLARLKKVEGYDGMCAGELLLYGDSIFQGYYKRPEVTQEAFIKIDGVEWLKTGDICSFDEGEFHIIGRAKEQFKTSYGEYINPEKIENVLSGGLISDMFITSTRTSDFLLAIVVVNDEADMNEDFVLTEIKTRGLIEANSGSINKYEIPSFCYVINTPFNELDDGNLVTPTLKKRRTKLYQYFKDEIERRLNK
ncbi:ACSL5 [Hepatospora eriocheir]|uniref:ACSL5 n=2 Tax=Hepatospora eriocheir TaxID=1081669 RepID=A0A1X0Q9Z3_9MICR|nr:ACSL5 [Hepatospora eriocheir]